jgi:outer membrane protein assembly factor BamB
MVSRVVLIVSIVVACSVPYADAQTNWPQFRGPNANGAFPLSGLPTTWNVETGTNILWKKPIPGLGHSSPVVWGDKLFVTTAINQSKEAPLKVGLYGDPGSAEDNDVQQWKVFCLNKRNGALLWDKTACEGAPRLKRHTKASHANCTVATDGTNLVAFFGSEGLYCFDLSGQLRWKKNLGVLRTSPVVYNDVVDPQGIDLEWGFASSPVLYRDRVIVQCDILTNGFIAALRLTDGQELWRTRRDDTATWSTPTVCTDCPRPQVIVNGWKHMGGYDLQTGEEIWRMSGGGDCPVPTPLVWNKLIFLTSAHGPRRPLYAVRTDATGDVSLRDGASRNQYVVWSAIRGGSYMQTPLVYGDSRFTDLLYSCHTDGILSCYEPETGKQIYRERLGSGGDGFTASPVAAAESIFFTSERGAVYVVKPGPAFSVVATNQLKEVCMATPAISENVIYFRTQSHLVAVGQRE